MRKYKFEEFQKELKKRYYANFSSLEPGKLPGRRERRQEDLDILLEMMILRNKKWLKSGKLVELGARKYKLVTEGEKDESRKDSYIGNDLPVFCDHG